MECELFTLRRFGTNCNFLTLGGICDANGCTEYGLNLELACVNCGANGVFNGETVNCDANAFSQLVELSLCGMVNSDANGCVTFSEGKFDFNMLLNFLIAVCRLVIKCFIESRILEIVATTKCSSYVDIFLALAKGFLEM